MCDGLVCLVCLQMSFARMRMPEGALEQAVRAAAVAWGLLSKSPWLSGIALALYSILFRARQH